MNLTVITVVSNLKQRVEEISMKQVFTKILHLNASIV